MLTEIWFCQVYSGGKFSGNKGATFSSTTWEFQKKIEICSSKWVDQKTFCRVNCFITSKVLII